MSDTVTQRANAMLGTKDGREALAATVAQFEMSVLDCLYIGAALQGWLNSGEIKVESTSKLAEELRDFFGEISAQGVVLAERNLEEDTLNEEVAQAYPVAVTKGD